MSTETVEKLLTQVETLIEDNRKLADKFDTTMKSVNDEKGDSLKAIEKNKDEAKKALDEVSKQIVDQEKTLQDKFLLIEQKLESLPANDEKVDKTAGEEFVDSDELKAFVKAGGKGRLSIEVGEIIRKTTFTSTSAGSAIRGQRLPGVVPLQLRRRTIRDLLPMGQTASNAVEYVRETSFTNAAAPQVEAAAKAESAYAVSVESAPVRTIAHWIPATNQVLDDWPQLRSLIDTRMTVGLELEEEDQILAGDGTGQNLSGLITEATAYASGTYNVSGDQKLDQIRHMILQARLAEYPVTGIVLHPEDWHDIELLKDGDNRYIIGDPKTQLGATLWGRPVVETTAISAQEVLVGAFAQGAQVWDRQRATVEVSTEHSDYFVRNMVAIRAEERLALTVYRPAAFVTGSIVNSVP